MDISWISSAHLLVMSEERETGYFKAQIKAITTQREEGRSTTVATAQRGIG